MQLSPNVSVNQSVPAQSISAATVNGAVVDTATYDEAMIILNVGTVVATGTLNVKVQEDDNLAFASPVDISGAAFTEVTPSNDVVTYVGLIKLQGRQRYLRVVHTAATAASVSSSDIVLGNPIVKPAQTPQFSV